MKYLVLALCFGSLFASAKSSVCREDFGGQFQEFAEVRTFSDGTKSVFITDTEGAGGVTYLTRDEDMSIFHGTKEETTAGKISDLGQDEG